jgi:drug/metabolite transporter (DMT)-like permease
MIPSLLAVCFFSIGASFGNRAVRCWGEHGANLIRIVIAGIILGVWAFGFGKGLSDKSNLWFFASGVIGFGVGDTGLFLAFPRIGIQLTTLMTLCLSAVIASVIEYLWMGTPLTSGQILSASVILLGVIIVILGSPKIQAGTGNKIGYFWGLVAALGQGGGAVLSRKGYDVAEVSVDFGTAAFERVIGGVLFILIIYLFYRFRATYVPVERKALTTREKYLPVFIVAIFGPILGVSCFQWALSIAPGGVVLPVVAMTPIAIIPFAYFINGELPTKRSLAGGVVAVVGTMMMTYFSV